MNGRYLFTMKNCMLAVVLLFCFVFVVFAQTTGEQTVAVYETTANLNLRAEPTTSARVITTVSKGTKLNVTGFRQNNWAEVTYNNTKLFASRDYLKYLYPVSTEPAQLSSKDDSFPSSLLLFLYDVWDIIKYILGIGVILLILAFKDQLIEMAIFCAFFAGIGTLITYLLFDDGEIGATIGLCVAIIIAIRQIANYFDVRASWFFTIIYCLVMLPVYLLNKMQFILVEPWRYFFKRDWLPESMMTSTRLTLNFIKIILYIVTTPLRLVNAIVYNLIIRFLFGIYDLLFEVLQPSSYDEGGDDILSWLLWAPIRFIKYPVFHGSVLLIEGVIWTIVDIFIPAITLYHGTDLLAAQAIVCSPQRNTYLKRTSPWTNGTFTASNSCWGGIGVYFSASYFVARTYATDDFRLSDDNPVMIVCRVSLGAVLNYALTPVYYAAGQYGNPKRLNAYASQHGYTTGEWWNGRGGYWEYCLFDWKDKYNHPWRIRPVYVYNFRTGLVQHIEGAMQHWLFDRVILNDILSSMSS